MIKAVLFDYDGTLVNTLPLYIRAYDKSLRSIGFTLSEKEVAKTCFNRSEDAICASLAVPEKTKVFADAYFTSIKILAKEAPLFDDTIKMLHFLKNHNIKIIVITFAYRWYIDQMINHHQLGHFFDFIISADDVVNTKPHPEAVLKAIKQLNVQPRETLVVGDSKNDILMGKAAGSKTVLFTRKEYDLFYSLAELKKTNPDFIVTDLSQIKKLIL